MAASRPRKIGSDSCAATARGAAATGVTPVWPPAPGNGSPGPSCKWARLEESASAAPSATTRKTTAARLARGSNAEAPSTGSVYMSDAEQALRSRVTSMSAAHRKDREILQLLLSYTRVYA